MPRERRPLPPLDGPALERLALRYVERFATTRGRLTDYLVRKRRERGWQGEPVDPAGIADRMAALGYIDDRAYAEAKAAAMARRGLGARRVADAWRQARIGAEDTGALVTQVEAREGDAALAFARRKRIGPFATAPADREQQRRQIAQMARAGHGFALSRRIVEAAPGETIVLDEAFSCCDENGTW